MLLHMALIYLYKPLLVKGDTFTANQLKITRLGSGITYKETLNGVDEFEFALPASDDFCSYVQKHHIISIDNQFFGIVRQLKQNIQNNSNVVTVSGDGIKGYLEQFITLYPAVAIASGLQGYDAIKDVSTETVVKYFINNNIVNPTNSKRKITGFEVAPDLHRGIANDKYMSRFEPLSEVCTKNLEPQKMGYKIDVDIKNSKLIFDVIKGVDRTTKQSQNNRVIFDVAYKSLASLEYFNSVKNYKNIFYASLSKARNEAQTMTCMYSRDGETEANGVNRFEQHLNVSINLPLDDIYSQLKQYALKDASNYEEVETITATATQKYRFAVDYNLGDFVTVQARHGLFKRKLATLDVQITGINHRWTRSGNIIHEPCFGTGKISKFEVLERKIKNGGF